MSIYERWSTAKWNYLIHIASITSYLVDLSVTLFGLKLLETVGYIGPIYTIPATKGLTLSAPRYSLSFLFTLRRRKKYPEFIKYVSYLKP